jgi:hypothetical protein
MRHLRFSYSTDSGDYCLLGCNTTVSMLRVDPEDGGRAETVHIPIPFIKDTGTAC